MESKNKLGGNEEESSLEVNYGKGLLLNHTKFQVNLTKCERIGIIFLRMCGADI